MSMLILVMAVGAAVHAIRTHRQPNIIWIIADDFGYNDLGLHNQQNEDVIQTPHLNELAQGDHGILLENSYSQPICSPTRSQLLSGR